MLYLVSLGVSDEKDISLKGLEIAKSCDIIYWEQYTTKMNTSVKKLESLIGKPVTLLERAGMEDRSHDLIEQAKSKDVCILVGGDALSATTHCSLLLDCKKNSVSFKVIHSSSILTSVGESGLSLYKFGETITVPRWKDNYKPAGFYDTILKNKKSGLHTLVLMEIDMNAEEAIKTILDIDKGEHLLNTGVVSISGSGSDSQEIKYQKIQDVSAKHPAIIIIPGKLNVFEKEYLESL